LKILIEMTWLMSHVRQLLQAEWDVYRVPVDDDGDLGLRSKTAACWVSVVLLDGEPHVRVWAHAAHSVRRTAKLTAELCEINARCGPAPGPSDCLTSARSAGLEPATS
jgi:hypothetical protein